MATAQPAPRPPQAQRPWTKAILASLERWLLWRIPVAAAWYWLVGAIVYKATDTHILPSPAWLPLTLFIAIAIIALWRGWLLLIGYLLYLLFFPLAQPILFLWRLPGYSTTLSRAFSPLTGLIGGTLCFSTLVILWLLLLSLKDENVLRLLIGLLLTVNTVFLISSLRWASDPLRPFLALTRLITFVLNWLDTLKTVRPSNEEDRKKHREGNLRILGFLALFVSRLKASLDHWTRQALVPLFTALLIIVYFVTITSFAAAMHASQRLPEPAFGGLETNYYSCWLFSLTVLSTSPLSSVNITTDLGRFIYSAELFSTFLILSVLFSMFSAAMGIIGEERYDELDREFDQIREWIRRKHSEWDSPIIEAATVEQGEPHSEPSPLDTTANPLPSPPDQKSEDGGELEQQEGESDPHPKAP